MSLSQQQLESMLWGAAEFLRGQIDASDLLTIHFSPSFL
jgi:hypothetical protein